MKNEILKRKNYLVIALGICLMAAAVFGVKTVKAQGANNSNLVDLLVEKFNLSRDDVLGVFNQYRGQRQEEMQNRYEERLNQAVTDGKITEEQKQQILTKHQEIVNSKEDWQNLTPEERKAKNDALRTEMQNWTSQNNIDLPYLNMGMGPKFGRGFKAGYRMNTGK